MRRAKGLELARVDAAIGADRMPRTRGECSEAQRPCMHLACRHHLALDVLPGDRIGLAGGDVLPGNPTDGDLEAAADEVIARVLTVGSCTLDLADAGPTTLDVVGQRLNVTRERIRQIETKAMRTLGPRVRRHLGQELGELASEALVPQGDPA